MSRPLILLHTKSLKYTNVNRRVYLNLNVCVFGLKAVHIKNDNDKVKNDNIKTTIQLKSPEERINDKTLTANQTAFEFKKLARLKCEAQACNKES